jgi:hypothetical protein
VLSLLLAIAANRPYPSGGGRSRRRGKGRAGSGHLQPLESVLEPVLRAWSLAPEQFEDLQSFVDLSGDLAPDRKIKDAGEESDLAVIRRLMQLLNELGRRRLRRDLTR